MLKILSFEYEQAFLKELNKPLNTESIAGCDEVGRGCIAGPVVGCALAFKADTPTKLLEQVQDSKALSTKKRIELSIQINEHAYFAIASIAVDIIDKINILEASLLAMNHAYITLANNCPIEALLIDGNKSFHTNIPTKTIVKGDTKSLSIAGASIMAKVYRDKLMQQAAKDFPEYDFDKNVGYPTKPHIFAINLYGICPLHRKSFKPIKQLLKTQLF